MKTLRFSDDEFERIAQSHQEWLKTKGKRGCRADFYEACFAGVWRLELDIQNANFSKADLSYAGLNMAQVSGSDFSNARMSNISCKSMLALRCNFNGADLRRANLWRSSLRDSSFVDADCRNAYFDETNCYAADLRGANLAEASAARVIFRNADLSHAILRGANCKYADFNGAVLDFADLRRCQGLTPDQLITAQSLRGAKMDARMRDTIEKSRPPQRSGYRTSRIPHSLRRRMDICSVCIGDALGSGHAKTMLSGCRSQRSTALAGFYAMF